MVQLLAYDYGAESRPTTDIDVLGNARRRPSGTRTLAQILDDLGADMAIPPSTNPRSGYKFRNPQPRASPPATPAPAEIA